MRSQISITDKFLLIAFAAVCLLPAGAFCQTRSLAILTPNNNETSKNFARILTDGLDGRFEIIDRGIANSAFRAAEIGEPFNQTIETAQTLASSIGCEYFLLVNAETQRRAGIRQPDYFESSAAIYVVNGRTGVLIDWKLYVHKADSPAAADKLRDAAADAIEDAIVAAIDNETEEASLPEIAEPPTDPPASVTFRAPIPYKRMKPDLTEQSSIYNVEATVDILVDVGADGAILRTKIVRWAGYGLDESVAANVRRMNWRPAEMNGKHLPMRILLRYNFKNVPTSEQ